MKLTMVDLFCGAGGANVGTHLALEELGIPAADVCAHAVNHWDLAVAWGPTAERRFFGDKHWNEPLKWNRAAEKAGVRARVFCSSMADVFEDGRRSELEPHRVRLWKLIEATPWLDWLLLTKRPENIPHMLPTIQIGGEELPRFDNVWLGATVCTQADADKNIPELLQAPAAVHFLSVEPLLESIALSPRAPSSYQMLSRFYGADGFDPEGKQTVQDRMTGFFPKLDWIIIGGESGPHARPCRLEWIRSIVRQCRGAGVVPFVKQLGAKIVGDHADFCVQRWFCSDGRVFVPPIIGERANVQPADATAFGLASPAAADPSEWPEDLRVQELPKGPQRP